MFLVSPLLMCFDVQVCVNGFDEKVPVLLHKVLNTLLTPQTIDEQGTRFSMLFEKVWCWCWCWCFSSCMCSRVRSGVCVFVYFCFCFCLYTCMCSRAWCCVCAFVCENVSVFVCVRVCIYEINTRIYVCISM